MRLETRKLADLKPAAYNPRKALKPGDPEYEKLAISIEKNGYIDPIVINEDGTIIGGHQRRTVMMDLGYTEAEVCIVDIPDKNDEIAANIALNQISGEWDNDKLMGLLIDLESAGHDTMAAGFNSADLTQLFNTVEITQEANDDGFDPYAAMEQQEETEPITQPGDIWQLGEHRLMCGDASDFSDVGILMGGKEADLIITDPPYNVDYEAKDKALEKSYKRNTTRKNNEILNDKMSDGDFYNFLLQVFSNIFDAARKGAAVYVFHADSEGLTFRQAFDAAGFKLAEVLIWEKNQFVIGRQDYHWRHEPILYGWKEGAGHYFIDDRSQDNVFIEDDIDFESMKKSDLVAYIEQVRAKLYERTTVQYEKKPAKSNMHPTMKPVALVGRLMLNSSRRGDAVADYFGGSGTTLIAAEQLGRIAYLMEVSPQYCDIIVKRWEEYTGKKAVRVRGGDA
jgi:DNA modification methylase